MGFTAETLPDEVVAGLPPDLQAQAPLYDESRQGLIIATLAVCTAVAYLALALRLYARRVAAQALGLDDLFAGLAVIFTSASVGLTGYLTELGLGRHQIVIALENDDGGAMIGKINITLTTLYVPILFCIKASALFLYRRLFPSTRFHVVCYVVLALTAIWTLTAILVLTISCLPPRPPTPEMPVALLKCPISYLNTSFLYILVVNVVLDFVVLCLPLPLIWRLQTTVRRKLQITLVFTLGSFIFAISIMRVVAMNNLGPVDDWWDSIDAHLWSVAESAVGILTVSIPVMQPTFRKLFYRQDGTPRIGRCRNDVIGDGTARSRSPFDMLTFGRTGVKGPTGGRRHGPDMTVLRTSVRTDATLFVDDAERHGSGAGLVAGSRSSRDSRTTLEP